MKYEISVIVKAVNSDFWQTILSGAKAFMRDQPERVAVSVFGPPEESDVLEQVAILEEIVNKKPDGIVIASTSNDLTVPAIERAMAQGIPVVTLDNQVSTDKVVCFMGTDSRVAAGNAAEAMLADWNANGVDYSTGKVMIINSCKSSKVDLDRDAGFEARMKEIAPSVSFLETQYVENDPILTEQVVVDTLKTEPNLIGIFADNDMTGVGVANGLKKSGRDSVYAYAFDANDVEIEAVKDGYLRGMIVQKPFEMGYRAVGYAIDAKEGKQVPSMVDTGGIVVTKENVDTPDVKTLLYPEKL